MDDMEDPTDAFNRAMAEVIVKTRDERRPELRDVVRVIDDCFRRLTAEGEIDIALTTDGPDQWIWTDRHLEKMGFEKVYVLGVSHMAGAEGYPMVTVRQTVAPHFDAAITFSTVVFGPTDDDIARSMAVLVANHTAAFAGVRKSMQAYIDGGIPAALARLEEDTPETAGSVSTKGTKTEDLN